MKRIRLAGCIIFDPQGKVLLIHRNTPKRTQWETPGGKIEDEENPEKAAQREAKEELGIQVKIVRLLGKRDFQEDQFVMEYTWFLAKTMNSQPELMEPDKFDDLKYFSWEELKSMSDLSANTQNLVNSFYQGELLFN